MKCTYRGLPKRHGQGSFIHCQYLGRKQNQASSFSLSLSISFSFNLAVHTNARHETKEELWWSHRRCIHCLFIHSLMFRKMTLKGGCLGLAQTKFTVPCIGILGNIHSRFIPPFNSPLFIIYWVLQDRIR